MKRWQKALNHAIYFDSVHKVYNGNHALRDATFKVPRGAIAGLLGPNGSGKTTSLKLALGLIKPTQGAVLVNGEDPWTEPRVRATIGYLPESPIYPRHVRVRSLLRHIARLKGASMGDVDRIASMMGIKPYMDKQVASLSRGYLQRLGLSLALLGDPQVLLLDEPTANLDPKARVDILGLIKDVSEMLGATVVISSHILPELQEVVDYLIIISGGEVLDYGPLEELAKKYGAKMVYHVSTRSPRIVARDLINLHYIEGVVVKNGGLMVYVNSAHHLALETRLEDMRMEGLIEDYRVEAGLLGEIYEAVTSS